MLLVGTANRHKLDEIRALLAASPCEVVGTESLPDQRPVPEDRETFLENARLKACEFARRALALPAESRPRWVIADDSGLVVDALGGAPGVYSARYAGEGCSFADNNRKLLRALEGLPEASRSARFVCALVCVDVAPEPRVLFQVEGVCEGSIALEERGSGGFGYDPLFIDPATGRTFAELKPEEKNARSHRGRALSAFRSWFDDLRAGT